MTAWTRKGAWSAVVVGVAASGVGGYWLVRADRPVVIEVGRFERSTPTWISEHEGEGASFTADVPRVVGGCSQAAQDILNQALVELVEMRYEGLTHRTMAQQAERLVKTWRDCRDEDPDGASSARSWTRRDAEVLLNDGQTLSVQVSEAWYSGGAHCNYCSQQASFDVRTGRKLAITDFIRSDARSALATIVLDGLVAATGGEWGRDRQELLDTIARFRNVAVVADGLRFVFDPYEIAPFSAGTIRHVVSWPDISHLLAHGSAAH